MANPEVIELSIKNGKTKVLVAGEGKPVVFLHGAGGLQWDDYLDRLSENFKVYAPYFPGAGGTPGSRKQDIHNFWDICLYYYDLFDQLELDQLSLIGHSFGGMIAAELAATDNRRFDNLLLLCPGGLWKEEIEKITPSLEGDLNSKLFYDNESEVAKKHFAMPEDKDELFKVLLEAQSMLAEALSFMWPLPDKGLSRRLYRIKADTTIVWGKEDQIVPPAYAYEFQKKIPDSNVVMLEKTAHYPQLEQLEKVLKISNDLFSLELVK